MARTKQPHQLADAGTRTSLAGCNICFVDATFDAIPKHHDQLPDSWTELQQAIVNCGGDTVRKVHSCTHLVSTEDQFIKRGARIRDGIASSLPILTYDWLVASLGSDDIVDTTPYLLDEPAIGKSTAQPDDSGYASPLAYGTAKPRGASSKRSIGDADADADDRDSKKPRTSTSGVIIPVDEHFFGSVGCQVYVDENGVAYDATLNQTDSSKNSNKFYRCQIIRKPNGDSVCWIRWGRVGEAGNRMALGDGSLNDAVLHFEKKFKDKTGHQWVNREAKPKAKKYARIEISYEPEEEVEQDYSNGRRGSAVSVASTKSAAHSKLASSVEKLMNFIFDNKHIETTLAQLEYDPTRMPLGNLSQNTLRRGYQALQDLAGLIGNIGYGDNNLRVQDLSNQYYTLIPHAFGRKTVPPVLNDAAMIKKEINLLENLTDLRLSNEIMQKINTAQTEQLALADRQYDGLGLEEMTPLVKTTREYTELSDYLIRSAGQTHGFAYDVEDIFRIERKGEANLFAKSPFATLPPNRSRRALLWHGSRSTNFPGILSQGLRIAPPEAPVSGYMFGKGIYLANISTKSANYCFPHASANVGLLLLCEAELGTPSLKLKSASYNAGEEASNQDAISTWGVGMTTVKGYKDAGCVHPDLEGVEMPDVSEIPGPSKETGLALQYDEFIVYSVPQVRLRYLFRVKMNTRW